MTKRDQPFTPSWLSTLPHIQPAKFRAFRQFNHAQRDAIDFGPDRHEPTSTAEPARTAELCHLKTRLNRDKLIHFASDRMPDKVARVLGELKLVDVKEVVESFEFFQRVRHRVSRADIVDLCCGHGLVGMLFALLERRVERVTLLDARFPPSTYKIEAALQAQWPWVSQKLRRIERSVKGAETELPQGAGVVAVHACGARTDWSLEVARKLGGPLAVMPCCYTHQVYRGPETLKKHLGVTLSVDVQRTLDLNEGGYQVEWQEIPPAITPKNRIIAATPHESEHRLRMMTDDDVR